VSLIRAGRPDDIDALYQVCLETADAGGDATALFDDSQLVGHIFAAPYLVFEPGLTFVAEDTEGVGGYVLGALDSRTFAATLDREWWPGLRERYPENRTWRPDEQRMVSYIHHPPAIDDRLHAEHPSHLHINFVSRMQGQGLGGRIMHTFLDALRAQGSRGVHLHVWKRNERAIGFYRHLGFVELGGDEGGYTLGMRLN
jgi:ribosomal protein S18 acetylase RimI-like enzyme